MNYNNLTEFETRYKNGEKEEDFGGLSVFLDLKRVGFVLQPEEIGCDRCEIFVFFLLSFPQNERKIYYFCSVCMFFEGSVFTFQFLNDKIHNYVFLT